MQAKVSKKSPYKEYSQLKDKGVKIVWGDPANPDSNLEASYDVVYDNNGKDLEACQPLIDKYKVKIS